MVPLVSAEVLVINETFTEDTTILLSNKDITALTITGNHTGAESNATLVTDQGSRRVVGVLGTIEFEDQCAQTCEFIQEQAQYLQLEVNGSLYIKNIKTQEKVTLKQQEQITIQETAWFNSSWQNRTQITIQSSQVNEDITNFTIYLNLADMPTEFWNNVQSDGDDIRITQSDGTTQVPVELVWINTSTQQGEVHFQANISSTNNTVFYLYYGNDTVSAPAVNSTYGRNNVWSAYEAVWHLQEIGTNTSKEYLDSTGNGHDGQGDPAPPSINAKLGRGANFSNHSIPTDNQSGFDYTYGEDFTVTEWGIVRGGSFVRLAGVSRGCNPGWSIRVTDWNDNYEYCAGSSTPTITPSASYQNGSYWYSVHEFNTSNDIIKLYLNDVLQGNASITNGTLANGNPIQIGTATWTGIKDEVRVRNSIPSAAWKTAEYTNQNNPLSFYTIGTSEVESPTEPQTSTFGGATTNFSAAGDITNVSNAVIEKPSYGKIVWNNPINASQADFDTYVKMGASWIYVNSSQFHSTINSSANLTLYGGFEAAEILRNGEECSAVTSPKCEVISFNSTAIVFNVTQFSNYTVNGSAPTHDTPILNSTDGTNTTTQNLTVYPQNVVDADADSFTTITDWRVEATSVAVLNAPLDTNTTATDYSTYQNNGSVGRGISSATPQWVETCVIGGCYDFDGTNDLIDFGNDTSLKMRENFTVSAWINTSVSVDTHTILARYDFGNNRRVWQLNMQPDGRIRAYVDETGTTANTKSYYTTATVDDGNWHHVAITFGGGELKVYLNGTLASITNDSDDSFSTVADETVNVTLGTMLSNDALDNEFDGLIDEPKIYDRVLTQEQLYQEYRHGLDHLQGNPTNTRTLVSQETTLGENWSAAITPTDGFEDGTTKTSNTLQIIEATGIQPTANNFDGQTTNFLAEENLSVVNLVLEISQYGKINWSNPVNVSGADFDTYIDISSDYVFVNSSALDASLNSSAEITLYGDFAGPTIYKDGIECNAGTTPACEIVLENSTHFIFNVTEFSNYTINGSAPTHDTPILNSSSATNTTNENLTVYPQNVNDPDNDSFTTITDWRKENTSIAIINMPFDSNVTNVSVGKIRDYSTYQNNGTLGNGTSGDAPVWTETGVAGGAYYYDGLNDKIQIPYSAEMNTTTAYTVEAWYNHTGNTGTDALAEKGYGDLQSYSTWGMYVDPPQFYHQESAGVDAIASTTNPGAGWHHWVGVWNGTHILLYIDGVLEDTDPTTGIVMDTNDVFIGESTSGGGRQYFDGEIDEFRFYDYALTPEQIAANYNSGTPRYNLTVSQETTVGENWSAAVTPTDGLYDGTTKISNTVEILMGNIAPTHDTPILNSTDGTNTTNENLTVYPQNLTDADEDNITTTIDWRVNNVSKAVLNLAFDINISNNTTGAVRDYTTYENNATLGTGTTMPTWVQNGAKGGAYDFDGTNDVIEIQHSNSVNTSNAYTIEFWYDDQGTSGFQGLAEKAIGSRTTDQSWGFYELNDNVYFYHEDAEGGSTELDTESSTGITTGFNHLLATWNGTTVSFYVNGELKETAQHSTLNMDTSSIYIGEATDGTSSLYYADGIIDEFRIYNYSFSQEQIAAQYNSGTPRYNLTVSQETNIGENWSAAITPNDGLYDGTTKKSSTLEIIEPPSSVLFNDTFTDTDGTSITSHTPDVGTNWTEYYNTVGTGEIINNSYTYNGSTTQYAGFAHYTNELSVSDYDVTAQLTLLNGAAHMYARFQDTNNHYIAVFDANTSNVYIQEYVSGTPSTLASTSRSISYTNQEVTFQVNNNTLTLYEGDTSILSVNDSTFTSAGSAGIGIGTTDDGLTALTIATNTSFDNFLVAEIETTTAPQDTMYGSSTSWSWGDGSGSLVRDGDATSWSWVDASSTTGTQPNGTATNWSWQ